MTNENERVEVRIPVAVCLCGSWCAGPGPGANHDDAQSLVACGCEVGTPWANYYITATLARPKPQRAVDIEGTVQQ